MTGESILIVEDEQAIVRILENLLNLEGFQTLSVDSGERALELARTRDPKLILLDLRLPGISGFDVCRELRAEGRRMPIIMLTGKDGEIDKVLGLELGADDYIVKPYQPHELLARIRALLRRAYGDLAHATNGERLYFGNMVIDLETLQVSRDGQVIFLTPTEFRLLRYLVSHPNRPFSRALLIEAIWGYEETIGDERTVDVHMRHLREKLETNPTEPRYLTTVRGVGYKFQP